MIVTLTGENSFLLQRELRTRTADFVKEHDDLALERLDGEEASFEQIEEALTSLPFLASKKMVVLRSPSLQKQFLERAEQLFSGLSETTDVLLVEPKLDKRLAYYKLLKKQTEFVEYTMPDSFALAKFAVQAANEAGAELSQKDAQYLVERIGANQQLLASEVQKLALSGKHIDRQIIDSLTEVAPQSKIFDLIDAAFAGDHQKALRLYGEQRRLKVEPQAIIGMLAWQLHIVALVSSGQGKSPADIAKEAKLSPFVVSKSASLAKRLSTSHIKTLVADLAAIDFASKTRAYDLDEALQNYILTI